MGTRCAQSKQRGGATERTWMSLANGRHGLGVRGSVNGVTCCVSAREAQLLRVRFYYVLFRAEPAFNRAELLYPRPWIEWRGVHTSLRGSLAQEVMREQKSERCSNL